MSKLYVALIHYPVLNKHKEIVTSAITNLDIHDIARASRTFGVTGYFIVNPSKPQQGIAGQIIEHWEKGYGATYNPDRKDALSVITLCDTTANAVDAIKQQCGVAPLLVATSAQATGETLSVDDLNVLRAKSDRPVLLLFGTGHGLVMDHFKIDHLLNPIYGVGDYNHLSVRSAVSIYLHELSKPYQQ